MPDLFTFFTFSLAALAVGLGTAAAQPAGRAGVWVLDNLSVVGGHAVTVMGTPLVVQAPMGPAVAFDGRGDGLFLETNPLEGLSRFTIEVVFSADTDGAEEQRFLHIQEATTENRALVELRLREGRFSLDTFLRSGDAQLTLIDREKSHAAGTWHVAALTFDGTTMAHYVDGVVEASGAVAFKPLGAGRTSIGVRQNRVSWFKGRIRTVRVSPRVLSPAELLPTPVAAARNSRHRDRGPAVR